MRNLPGTVYRQFALQEGWNERVNNGVGRQGAESGVPSPGGVYAVWAIADFIVDGDGGSLLVAGDQAQARTARVDQALRAAQQAIDERAQHAAQVGTMLNAIDEIRLQSMRADALRPKELVAVKIPASHVVSTKTVGRRTKAAPNSTRVDQAQIVAATIRGLHEQFAGRPDVERTAATMEYVRLSTRIDAARVYPSTVTPFGRWGWVQTLQRYRQRWYAWRLKRERTKRWRTFWTRFATVLEPAFRRSLYENYKEEFATAASSETLRRLNFAGSLDGKKLLGLGGLVLGVIGAEILAQTTVPDIFKPIVAAGIGGLGIAGTARLTWSRTDRRLTTTRTIYKRENSPEWLLSDLQSLLDILAGGDALTDFRLAVVVDGLDMPLHYDLVREIFGVVTSLFSAHRVSLIFVTDGDQFVRLQHDDQDSKGEDKRGSPPIRFKQKVFLAGTDYGDVRDYMDRIRPSSASSSEEQSDWEEVVSYLAFESRCDLFKLQALLEDMVQTTADRIPTLVLRYESAGRLEMAFKARLQMMINLVYYQVRYPSHTDDLLNSRLQEVLYETVDELQSLPMDHPGQPIRTDTSEPELRRRGARRLLLDLMEACQAVEPVFRDDGWGTVTYAWATIGAAPTLDAIRMDLDQAIVVAELEDTMTRWRTALSLED